MKVRACELQDVVFTISAVTQRLFAVVVGVVGVVCGATIDLYQGVLDACPMCDTIHTFNAPAPKPRATHASMTKAQRYEADRKASLPIYGKK